MTEDQFFRDLGAGFRQLADLCDNWAAHCSGAQDSGQQDLPLEPQAQSPGMQPQPQGAQEAPAEPFPNRILKVLRTLQGNTAVIQPILDQWYQSLNVTGFQQITEQYQAGFAAAIEAAVRDAGYPV